MGPKAKNVGAAVEIFHGATPTFRPVFIHRDFHPGNGLWHRSAVSGIVHWRAASIGPASVDEAHC
jgi:aminoglycoside/choline kinase family phosphotransferase